MANARRLLAEALAAFDAALTLEHYEVSKALELAGKVARESGETIEELRFEFIASYDSPPLETVTAECIDYWAARMKATRHPTLRARYADKVWDLCHKSTGNKPPIDAARIAIDGYAEALTTYPGMSFHSWGEIQKRIVDLALSISDEERLRKAVAANFAYANAEVDEGESEYRHQTLFAILLSIPPKRRPQAEFQAVIEDFRSRVEALDAKESDQFSMDRYALPLVDYYWASQQKEEAKTVLRMYSRAVERMANKTTLATLAVCWLNQLYELLLRYEMHDEARQVLSHIEAIQQRVPDDLVPISTSQNISKEAIDEWLNALVTDDVDESFVKVTEHFVPNLDELRRQVQQLRKDYPLSQMFTTTLVDSKGRAVAEVDPNDAEGRLIQQIHQQIQFRSVFLELGLNHMFEKHSIGPDELFARVTESPVWHEQRHAIMRRGIEAYFANDPIVAVHILVTEIESAIRIIAERLGLALQKQNRLGGFDLKNLSDFLADEAVTTFFAGDIATYLRVVLTDRRGCNLRNSTCHGMMPAANFTQATSRQLMHIVLLLSSVRAKPRAGEHGD